MKRYKIRWDYVSGGFREGEKFDLKKGDVVQLDDEAVAWLGRDQVGLLEEIMSLAEKKPEERAVEEPPQDRMVKAASKRSKAMRKKP